MDLQQRLGLIRAKSAPRQRAAEIVKPMIVRKGGLIVRGGDRPTRYGIGPRLSAPDRVAAWVGQPEARAKEWQPEYRHGAHVLTRIAERLRRH